MSLKANSDRGDATYEVVKNLIQVLHEDGILSDQSIVRLTGRIREAAAASHRFGHLGQAEVLRRDADFIEASLKPAAPRNPER